MKVCLVQMNALVGGIKANLEKILACVAYVEKNGSADLVVFPELALTGYPPEDLLYRGELYEQVEDALREVAKASTKVDILLGHPTREITHSKEIGSKAQKRPVEGKIVGEASFYNSASHFARGQGQATYHKRLLPNYRVFDEKRYFTSGMQPCVISVAGHSIGISICEDMWRAEPTRSSVDAGADRIININASPFYLGKAEERHQVLSERSKAHSVPILYVNMVGGQDELIFDGHSMAVDETGALSFELPNFAEQMAFVDWQDEKATLVEQVPIAEVYRSPWFVDPLHVKEAKAPLSEEFALYEALKIGVRDYVFKNGFKGAVIGLSGGIDSALTLCVAVDALGAERVQAVMMPSEYTSQISLDDAEALASNLGVQYSVIGIDDVFNCFNSALSPLFKGTETDTTEENLQARVRGTMLMAISNKFGSLVLTTGNKSELAVGYSTLYGDMAGGYNVLKDVSKHWVYRLSKHCNRDEVVIPERIITRPPSAELRHDQTDEDSLPPYEDLDAILKAYVEDNLDLESIADMGYDLTLVKNIISMVKRNEYKRFQSSPGPRVTHCAFGKDWRFPLTSGFRA